MRMGMHSGDCVAGVVGTKIPHYSVFGDTVEVAGLMESSGEPMKIQVYTDRWIVSIQFPIVLMYDTISRNFGVDISFGF